MGSFIPSGKMPTKNWASDTKKRRKVLGQQSAVSVPQLHQGSLG